MKCKNTIAMVLAGAMLLPSNAFAADLSQYKDFPNDWSAKSLEQAIDDGLLNGSNGMIDAKGLLTRAQMAAIVSRSFGAAKTASLDDYRDVLPSAWYYSDMGKAVKMGAFHGANGLLNPDAPITREEAFTVLARAFALEGGGSATLKDFVDGGTVSSWASESVAALVAGGYVNGANGMLNLKNNITRAEFAKVITGMAASYVGAEGVSGKTVEGNVIVRESGASLSGMTINGDLIIADSADKVSLDNVKVTGRIVIRGGADAVSIKDTTAGKGVLVSSPNGAAAISVSGGSVGTVTAKSDLTVTGGGVDKVVLEGGASLAVSKGASVGSVTVSDAGSKVSGEGTVTAVQANASSVTVSTKNTKVTAASGVSGVKAGDKTVEAGKSETVGSSSSSSSGGSSGGSHSSGGSSQSQYTYVLMNIPYANFYKAEMSDTSASVDAVSSATKAKTRSKRAAGSYHVNSDGSDISGVIYPVRVKNSDLSGLTRITDSDSKSITVSLPGKETTTEYKGKDALFESASYSYYVLSDTPSSYKEATLTDGKWSFGKATGTAVTDSEATISGFTTNGHHTNYEFTVKSDKITKGEKVYGIVLTDTEGNSYGLRHVVEIWNATKLGFNADSAVVGKTIKQITYYTDKGTFVLDLAKQQYIPQQAATATVTEADFAAGETTVTLSNDLPSDFTAAYSFTVNGEASNFFTYADGKITWDKSASDIPSGTYQLVIHDNSGKYADITAQIKLNVYAYASVPYDEYWKSEGVYLSGKDWTASNSEQDSHKENDKGAFDAVSRATQNHGLHRGSFQQSVVIHTADRDYHPVSWPDEGKGNTFIDADGNTYNKTEIGITSYNITGIKYVPVKVSASDFADFCTKYTVTKNGETMQGGYSEINLKSYTAVAAVDKDTNGLKTVTKGRGGYTFGKRQTGSGSGIKDTAIKTANAGIVPAAKEYSGNFGEMLRVDLDNTQDSTKYYGDLGSHMQTVVWKYYGNGDTVLATYGTKFAADDWMHKSMGIQLGLTDSLRFKLPEGTDGTGKWTLTVYALGYEDTTYTVTVTADNLPKKTEPMTSEQKAKLTQLTNVAEELLTHKTDSAYSTVDAKAWSDLEEHHGQAAALLKNADATTAEADELLSELPGMIATVKLAPVTETYTALFPVLTNEGNGYKAYWNASVKKYFEDNNKTVTDEQIEQYAEYLRTVCQGTKYGADAVEAYKGSENYQFNCTFINGVDTIQFNGSTISGTKDSTEVFSHTYTYEGEVTVGEGEMSFTGDLYKTSDANAGEFTYFIMRDDTPGTTQHIEFRYGSDLEQLKGFITGDYAYWLAAGIPVNSDETFVKKCIDLFVSENLAGVNPSTPNEPTTTVKYGQYTISDDDLDDPYTVMLKVTLNSDGTIKLVEDNGTEPGESNTGFWDKAKNGYTDKKLNKTYIGLFTSLIGKKTAKDIDDNVDAVSKATVSSNAIKEAVKNALSNN